MFWEEKRRGIGTEASTYIDLHPIVMLDNTLGELLEEAGPDTMKHIPLCLMIAVYQ